ncbi:hypothetical protein Pla123a_14490 [Posidoniimonas polymericola]|uniref:DUF2262 domain-containing protein n=1 Tax=Posidoniimonas polymericola TaxID=2528002 RepID=A0A5C5YS45_9BACT|nr:DUF2262 domain-containing protein [Posidoniimonas polymericola]TWT77653.1 hypothetical protein Pla123a_14490 [Posidoniimonas polymericola]
MPTYPNQIQDPTFGRLRLFGRFDDSTAAYNGKTTLWDRRIGLTLNTDSHGDLALAAKLAKRFCKGTKSSRARIDAYIKQHVLPAVNRMREFDDLAPIDLEKLHKTLKVYSMEAYSDGEIYLWYKTGRVVPGDHDLKILGDALGQIAEFEFIG